ncbi:MAG: hypothetical protein WA872_05220 [Candidatus Sulfotelmatobacter sp.]
MYQNRRLKPGWRGLASVRERALCFGTVSRACASSHFDASEAYRHRAWSLAPGYNNYAADIIFRHNAEAEKIA